jgi:hypothetical protein
MIAIFVPAPSPRLRRAPSPVATGEGWGAGRPKVGQPEATA